MRTNELHPAYTSTTYAPNALPATGRQSLNPGAGSTGSQSGSQVGFDLLRTSMTSFDLNPYLVHFGNIQERHLWKKIQNLLFDL